LVAKCARSALLDDVHVPPIFFPGIKPFSSM
jgi:hypothetical protein